MELQGRSWPNLLGGVSGLGRPAHIGAVVADLGERRHAVNFG